MLYHAKNIEQTLEDLDTTEDGLSSTEAEKRYKQYGPNTIKVTSEPLWRKIIEPFMDVFMGILFIAAVVSLLDNSYLDAAIIGIIMTASAVIYYVQRFSTERVLRSLRRYRKQTIDAVRDGKHVSVEASQLVPGDIVLIDEGEKIPADARIIRASALRVNESQLTGESTPINKHTRILPERKELYERSNMLFQGSFVVAGEAVAAVVATGNTTEFGKIANLAKNTAVKSPVQKKIDTLLSQIVIITLALAVVAFGLALMRGIPLAESLRFVVALSVSAVPEGLPVAISIILVLGMRRMAAKKALIRTMSAIETIGTITTIATDKTGTLTKNNLAIQALWEPSWNPGKLNSALPLVINRRKEAIHDPLDEAISVYSTENKLPIPRHTPSTAFPFNQATSMSGNLWHHGSDFNLALKGAPEAIMQLSDLSEDEREEAEIMLRKMTGEGYRVIAIAHQTLKSAPKKLSDISRKDKLQFAGFLAVADTIRPEAKRAIKRALQAGVSVRMITGDHFETAYHIGKQLGMVTKRDQVFDSRLISTMSDEAFEKSILNTRIFSRVTPEHKHRILTILKKHHITAMTGDGVNDVPALANADVGIAMGSGTQIAKDAGDIILLDDNFKSIIDAMHEGRTIAANIRRMFYYLLATNAGEVLTVLAALVVGMPMPLAPVQILWVNLVTDTCMVIPLGLEPGKTANMQEPPKPPSAPLLSRFMLSRLVLVAAVMASVALGLFVLYSNRHGEEYGRTIAFSALVAMQWASAFSARSDYQSVFSRLRVMNASFYIGLAAAVILQALALFGPLSAMLHVSSVAIGDLLVASTAAFVIILIVAELHKYIGRRFYNKGSQNLLANPKPNMVY